MTFFRQVKVVCFFFFVLLLENKHEFMLCLCIELWLLVTLENPLMNVSS